MNFATWTRELSRGIIHRSDETPRVLNWIYDIVDEDLEEEDESPGHSSVLSWRVRNESDREKRTPRLT